MNDVVNAVVDMTYTDRSLYSADAEFNQAIKERMGELIVEKKISGIEAAKKVGISPQRFKKWMVEDELFRNFIIGQENERNAELKIKIIDTIETIDDADKKAKALMEYLKHIDKEFGASYVKSEGFSIKATVNPAGFDKVRDIIEASKVQVEEIEQEVKVEQKS